MRYARFQLLVLAALLAGPLAQPARGGGWWSTIGMDGPYIGVGETVSVRAEFLFPTTEAAQSARSSGAYYAYIVRGMDERALDRAMRVAEPKDWWTPPPEIYRAGAVRLSGFESNLAVARAHVTVPDLPTGRYSLMLCTDRCVDPLGDIIPAGVHVSADASLAAEARRLAAATERLDLKESRARSELRRSARRVHELRRELSIEGRKSDELEERVRELVAAPDSGPRGGGPTGSAFWFAVGLIAGGAFAIRLRRGSASTRAAPGAPAAPAGAHR